jgi:fructokinase
LHLGDTAMAEFVHLDGDEPCDAELLGGVETGGSWCVCALGHGPEDLTAVEKFPTSDPDATIARIIDFFHHPDRPSAAAIGVGAFGPIELDPRSPSWGEIQPSTPKREWAGAALGARLRAGLEMPVVLDTDVNAAALGEHRWGAGRDVENLCYLTVGTGIGAGLIIGGEPVHGLLHPEAGHIRIPHDRERDPFGGDCPFHGDCWEGLASGSALQVRWDADPATLPGSHPAWALEAEYLAAGILAIVLITSPQRVIAGGGVMERPGLIGDVRERLRGLLGGYLGRPSLDRDLDHYLVTPGLGDDAGVLGAIALASDHLRRERGG